MASMRALANKGNAMATIAQNGNLMSTVAADYVGVDGSVSASAKHELFVCVKGGEFDRYKGSRTFATIYHWR